MVVKSNRALPSKIFDVSIFSPFPPFHFLETKPGSIFFVRALSFDPAIINDLTRVSRTTLENRPWSVPLRVSSRRNYNRTPNYRRWKGGNGERERRDGSGWEESGIALRLLPTATLVDSSRVRERREYRNPTLATSSAFALLVHNNFIL